MGFLRPAFCPLEFTGQQQQAEWNKNESRAGEKNHGNARDETDTANDSNDELARERVGLIEPKRMSQLRELFVRVFSDHDA